MLMAPDDRTDEMNDHYRKLERTYDSAPINRFYKPTVQISREKAVITFDVGTKMHHAAHAVHGSVCFKALDDAAFFAANSLVDDVFVLTVSFTIHMFRPTTAGTLTAKGWLTHRTGRLFFAESELTDQEGNHIARGSGTFTRSKILLTPEIGYR
jgi:uncharacterized protein (TIGR00369 family)